MRIKSTKAKKIINTTDGKAKYLHTEVESRDGSWDDSYTTDDGYYVIHDGKYHHVYKAVSTGTIKFKLKPETYRGKLIEIFTHDDWSKSVYVDGIYFGTYNLSKKEILRIVQKKINRDMKR